MRNFLFRALFFVLRALRPRGRRDLAPLHAGATVLYLQYERPLGCCVHGTPLIPALKAAVPGVRIVAATRGPGAETLLHDPGIDRLIVTEADPAGDLWPAVKELRARLAAEGIRSDVIVQDASTRRGRSALFAALLRLAPTMGFGDAPALYDRHLQYDSGMSLIDNNLRVAAALGGVGPHREPAVFFSANELEHARGLLRSLGRGRMGIVAFVLQGSGGQPTTWHDERFATVVRGLERVLYGTVFLGTGTDQPGIARVQAKAASRGLSVAGQTTIAQAAAVLCLCDLLITVDTGTMHLGRAVGVPMVVLGPSWQRPLEWLPLGLPHVRILRGPDRESAPPNYHLDEIGDGAVLAAAMELLQRYPPSPESREQRVKSRLSDTRA